MEALQVIHKTKIIEQVIDALKEYILKGEYMNGDFLPSEIELCKKMGVGRSTLREAVMILESQGFVRKIHGVGVMIVDESLRATAEMLRLVLLRKGYTMSELFEFRFINEIRTAELASINATSENLEEIEHHLDMMRKCNSINTEFMDADIEFHFAIAKASQNKVFTMILEIVRPLMEDMIKATMKYNNLPEHSMKCHEKIFNSIKLKDPERSSQAMKEHWAGTKMLLGFI